MSEPSGTTAIRCLSTWRSFAIAALLLAPAPLVAQREMAIDSALTNRVIGTIWTTLPSGETFRGSNATLYLWVDSPELRASLDAACAKGRANQLAWLTARTELEAPSGFALDSAAAADLALLRTIAAAPHATARADSLGGFSFIDVPFGKYWVEAEMTHGTEIVQWWDPMEMSQAMLTLARLLHADRTVKMEMGTKSFTRDQFCTASAPRMGLAAFASEIPPDAPGLSADHAYERVDEPAKVAVAGPTPVYPEMLRAAGTGGRVDYEFVVDTLGIADPRTFRVLRSSNLDFVSAVRESVMRTLYEPARLHGRKVRQVVRQSFIFSVSTTQLH